MSDPLRNTLSRTITSDISVGNVDRMKQFCDGGNWDGMLKAYGHEFLVDAFRERPINLQYGLQARVILVQKIISLGVDLGKTFLEIAHGGDLSPAEWVKALKPGAMIRAILKAPERNLGLTSAYQNLDEFLITIPIETIKRNAKHPEALLRRFNLTSEVELMQYASNAQKGKIIEDALGL